MAIRCVTGRKRELENSMVERIRQTLSETDKNVIVLVPSQITLQTELRLLSGQSGSFRLHVLSPSRLYKRVFQEVGMPQGVRIDKQGKTMLMRGVINTVKKNLSRYQSASDTAGFADKAVTQIEQLKQAHISSVGLKNYAETVKNPARREKLSDIALLYEEYERRIAGKFLDGEDETFAACSRMNQCAFVRDAVVFVHGFDTVSNVLMDTLIALGSTSRSDVTLFLVCDRNNNAPDFMVYNPVIQSIERFHVACAISHVLLSFKDLSVPEPVGELRALERMMFAYPVHPWKGAPKHVQAVTLKNPQEECEFVAGLARHLIMTKEGWRYRDILIACPNLDTEYADLLERAFRAHDVPLFLARSFTADRHPFARYFLALVRMVFTGITTQDMLLYMASGFSPVNGEDKDKMANYAQSHDMRQKDWSRPLQYGEDAPEIEPIRAALAEDIVRLSQAVREQESTLERLRLLFAHMETSGVCQRLAQSQNEDIAAGHRSWAAQTAQVYNRVIASMDQMAALVGEDKLPLALLPDLFEQALATQEIRELPQSPDAVQAGDLGHMKGESVKALFLLGQHDAAADGVYPLLDENETDLLSKEFKHYIGMNAQERAALRQFSLKEMLALPESYLFVSCPMSDSDGKANRKSPFFLNIQEIFPEMQGVDNVLMRDSMRKLRLNAKEAALIRLSALLREEAEGAFSGTQDTLRSGRDALYALHQAGETGAMAKAASTVLPESIRISPDLARKAYRNLRRVSITQLEAFAPCPHRHFLQYALRPDILRPFDLDKRATGTLLHGAVEKFVRKNAQTISEMSEAQCVEAMRLLAGDLLAEERSRGTLKGSGGVLTEKYIRRTLDVAASTLSRHLAHSKFKPERIECDIREGALRIDSETDVMGRIDRIDVYLSDKGRYIVVIDYKSGKSTFSLVDVFNGQRLQLCAYLQAAQTMLDAKGAGMFYFSVKDTLPDVKAGDEEKIETLRRSELRMDGMMLRDEDLFQIMTGGESQMLKISLNKDGTFRKDAKVLTPLQKDALDKRVLDYMRSYTRAIKDGDISMRPVVSEKATSCDTCPQRTCCPYDPLLPGAARLLRTLPAHKDEDVLSLLEQENA